MQRRKQKSPKKKCRSIARRQALVRDLQNMRQSLKAAGVLKQHTSVRPNAPYGEHKMLESLRDAHANIDRAIVMAQKGRMDFPAYLLGKLTGLVIAINDGEYIQWAAAQEQDSLGGEITAKVL